MKYLVCFLLPLFVVGCQRQQSAKPEQQRKPVGSNEKIVEASLLPPKNENIYTFGDSITIRLQQVTEAIIDSISISVGNYVQYNTRNWQPEITFQPQQTTVGKNNISIRVQASDSIRQFIQLSYYCRSDIVPENLEYELINTYPHDTRAYTQGLFYHNGYLYESTGQPGQSVVKKVEIKSGQAIKITSLESKLFGEGIAQVNDRIYQVTYLSQKGFVYDMNDFSVIREIYYDTREGWGLTYNGEYLIMSDGTPKLYFLDKQYFAEQRRVEVYDNKGLVPQLNELEYINGLVYANVYGENYIVAIEPTTGRVIKKINLEALFPENTPTDMDHVLNGIAFNPESKHFYVTGKYWPVLYEIKIPNH